MLQKRLHMQHGGFGNFTGIIDVPFSAYDISDPSSPRQLNIVVRDYDGNLMWDMHYEGDDEGENARRTITPGFSIQIMMRLLHGMLILMPRISWVRSM